MVRVLRCNRLLQAAEELDRHLDEQLSYASVRIEDAMRMLESFEQLMCVQVREKEALEAELQAIAAARAAAAPVAEDTVHVQEPLSGATKTPAVAAPPSPEPSVSSTSEPVVPAGVLLPGAVATADDDEQEERDIDGVDGALSDDIALH